MALMPTYRYRCDQGHEFERREPITAAPVETCPECGQPCRRLILGGAGVIFRGSGFYATDYGRGTRPGQERGPSRAQGDPEALQDPGPGPWTSGRDGPTRGP